MPLVILDRDGVINVESPDYIKSPDEWVPIAGSLEAIAQLKTAGYQVAVATNQSGVGRGYYTHETLQEIHEKMISAAVAVGGDIDIIRYCPHTPDDGCVCRKPEPGLFEALGRFYERSLQDVPAVGDSLRDLQASEAAGARPVLVKTGNGMKTLADPDLGANIPVYDDLAAFVKALLSGAANG